MREQRTLRITHFTLSVLAGLEADYVAYFDTELAVNVQLCQSRTDDTDELGMVSCNLAVSPIAKAYDAWNDKPRYKDDDGNKLDSKQNSNLDNLKKRV